MSAVILHASDLRREEEHWEPILTRSTELQPDLLPHLSRVFWVTAAMGRNYRFQGVEVIDGDVIEMEKATSESVK